MSILLQAMLPTFIVLGELLTFDIFQSFADLISFLRFQELSLRPDNFFCDTLLYAEDAWTRACRLAFIFVLSSLVLDPTEFQESFEQVLVYQDPFIETYWLFHKCFCEKRALAVCQRHWKPIYKVERCCFGEWFNEWWMMLVAIRAFFRAWKVQWVFDSRFTECPCVLWILTCVLMITCCQWEFKSTTT